MPSTEIVSKKNLRVCSRGHSYYKSSSCPVCPVCEKGKRGGGGFLDKLGAPARRALEGAGIDDLQLLSTKTEAEVLQLHGMGPSSIPKLKLALEREGLSFRTPNK